MNKFHIPKYSLTHNSRMPKRSDSWNIRIYIVCNFIRDAITSNFIEGGFGSIFEVDFEETNLKRTITPDNIPPDSNLDNIVEHVRRILDYILSENKTCYTRGDIE